MKRKIVAFLSMLFVTLLSSDILGGEPIGWESLGLYGGQMNVVTVDPVNPDIIFAGSWGGDGLFKSIDGGAQWEAIEGFRNDIIYSVAIDPENHERIWVATFNSIAQSSDGGTSWNTYNPGQTSERWRGYYSLAIDPANPDIVYVGCSGIDGEDRGGRVFKTEDGGKTWKQTTLLADQSIYDIAVNPIDTQEIWAVTSDFYYQKGNIYRSLNGGKSWSQVETGFVLGGFDEIVINPVNPKIIFVAGGWGIYRTRDGGKNWEQMRPSYDCRSLALDPHNPDTLYVGGYIHGLGRYGLFKSTDGGEHWRVISTGQCFLSLAVHPADSSIIYGGDILQGVFRSSDGGESWNPVNQGMNANITFCTTSSPSDSSIIFSATIAGLYKKEEGAWKEISSEAFNTITFDPSDSQKVYAGGFYLLIIDHGHENWISLTDITGDRKTKWITSILINPVNTGIIYISIAAYEDKSGEIYRSMDGGKTWSLVFRDKDASLNRLAIDPQDPKILYAGSGYFYAPPVPGNLYKSTNGGMSWETTSLTEKVVNAIALHPENPGILYVGTGDASDSLGGIYRSMDGGVTWEVSGYGIKEGATVMDIEFDPTDPDTIYAGTSRSGVYATFDGGEYWTLIGISDYEIYDISLSLQHESSTSSRFKGNKHSQDATTINSLYTSTASGGYRFTASGVGMVEGMVIDCANQQGVTGSEVITDTGGMALSLDGYYLIMAPAGICTVSAATDCYQPGYVEHVVVNEFDVAPVDLCILPQDGIAGKVTSKGKAVKGATVTISEEGVKTGETVTDENGRYALVDLQAGSYTISVIKKGYKLSTSEEIIYNGSNCIIQNFELVKK